MEILIQADLIEKLNKVIYEKIKFFYYLKLDLKLSTKQICFPKEII